MNRLTKFLVSYRSGRTLYGWNFIDKPIWMKWFVGRVERTLEVPTSALTASLVLPPSWALQNIAAKTASCRTSPAPHAALEGIGATRFIG